MLGHARSLLTSAVEHALLYAVAVVFGLLSLSWSLVGGLLHLMLPRRRSETLAPALTRIVARCFLRVMRMAGLAELHLGELDALRRDGPLIIAPNHPSLLDAVLIVSRLPRTVCITKAELWDNPLLGGGMRMAGYIRNDTPARLIRQALDRLGCGQQLLFFPEGTRTTCRPVDPFYGGFAIVAKLSGVPVQTVLIEVNSPFLGKRTSLFWKPSFPVVYRVRLGRRFEVSGSVKERVAIMEQYFAGQLGAVPPLPAGRA